MHQTCRSLEPVKFHSLCNFLRFEYKMTNVMTFRKIVYTWPYPITHLAFYGEEWWRIKWPKKPWTSKSSRDNSDLIRFTIWGGEKWQAVLVVHDKANQFRLDFFHQQKIDSRMVKTVDLSVKLESP